MGVSLTWQQSGFRQVMAVSPRRRLGTPAHDGRGREFPREIAVRIELGNLEVLTPRFVRAARRLSQGGHLIREVMFRAILADAYIEGGRFDEALACTAEARRIIARTSLDCYDAVIAVAEAHCARLRGDVEACKALLAQALASARSRNGWHWFRWLLNAPSRLLPLALEWGLDAETVRAVVRRLGIRPSPADPADWPWPIRVRTLGALRWSAKDNQSLSPVRRRNGRSSSSRRSSVRAVARSRSST